jgi:hypothetical protein
MNSEDFLLNLHYLSMFLAIVIPLYYWYVRKDRESMVLRIARGVRIVNAILYFGAFLFALELFWGEHLVTSAPFLLSLLLISYLLVRRWAPKQTPLLILPNHS